MAKRLAPTRWLVLATVALLTLSACEDPLNKILFFRGGGEAPPLPGERISVLTLQQALEPDPRMADVQVRLPRPYVNPDWPQAGGYPNHAMHHLAVGEALRQAWRVKVGDGSDGQRRLLASPVVAAGKVYVLDAKGRITAVDAETGDRLWRYSLTPRKEDSDSILGGGLAYYNGALYVATGFGEVMALDGETGGVIWRKHIGIPLRAAPAASSGRVFALSYDNQLHALSAATGEELWKHSGIVESAGLLGNASPAIDGGIVIAAYSSGELFALRVENGRVAWSDSLSRSTRLTPLASLADIKGRPVIDRGRVFAISHAGRLAAIELRTGARVWEREIGGVESPWVAGDYVYVVTTEAEVVCLSRREGRIRWVRTLQRFENEKKRKDAIQWSGPVLASDRLIVTSSHGFALTLSPYTGEVIGRTKLGADAKMSPVIAGGALYVLTDDGQLTAFR